MEPTLILSKVFPGQVAIVPFTNNWSAAVNFGGITLSKTVSAVNAVVQPKTFTESTSAN